MFLYYLTPRLKKVEISLPFMQYNVFLQRRTEKLMMAKPRLMDKLTTTDPTNCSSPCEVI